VGTGDWNQMSSIERYLKIRLDRRKVEGLAAHYKGPKKLKKSGKAAGSKKKKFSARKAQAGKKPGKKKPSVKRGKPAGISDGFDVLRKKK
jgi:hypothetical protein